MPAEIVLSGHGEPITDHVALIDERFAKHERRKEKIYGLIAEQPAHRLRARPGALGQRRRHPGLPHPLRGDRPRRPARQRGARARGRRRRGGPLRGDVGRAGRRRGPSGSDPARPVRPSADDRPAPRARAGAARAARAGAKKRMLIIVNPYATTVSDRLKNLVVYALQGRYEVEAVDDRGAEPRDRDRPRGARRRLRHRRRLRRRRHAERGRQRARRHRRPGLGAARRLDQRRLPHARHPQRRRRRDRAPARRSPTTWPPRKIDLGTVDGRHFVFACGVGHRRHRGQAGRRPPAAEGARRAAATTPGRRSRLLPRTTCATRSGCELEVDGETRRGGHRDRPELRPLHLLRQPPDPGLRGRRDRRRHALAGVLERAAQRDMPTLIPRALQREACRAARAPPDRRTSTTSPRRRSSSISHGRGRRRRARSRSRSTATTSAITASSSSARARRADDRRLTADR